MDANRSGLCAALLFAALVVCGCADTDPMIKLRRAGAVIQFDDERKTVEQVVLSKTASADELTGQLESLASVPRVVALDLSGTSVTDAHAEQLQQLHELQTLDLSNTAISDKGLEDLSKMTSLKKLTLSYTRVTDDGLSDHIPEFRSLETLELSRRNRPVRTSRSTADGGVLETFFSGIKLGIDLAGGANLVLEVDEDLAGEQGKEINQSVLSQMAVAINKRANPGGNKELTVRPLGTHRIEVIIPKADPQVVEQTKRMMMRLGSLELAILANSVDDAPLIARARALPPNQSKVTVVERGPDGKVVEIREEAEWLPVSPDGEVDAAYGVVIEPRALRDGREVDHVLVKYEPSDQRVKGEHLYRVYQTNDDNGRLAVGFTLNSIGAILFGDLTGKNEPLKAQNHYRRLAIVLDRQVHSAPTLESRISSSGIIRGDFTRQEINELIGVLDAGALEVPLKPEPVSELTISPTLGGDVQKKGVTAISIAALAVVVFMIFYYRFSGVVAVICLLLNLVLVMGTMIFIEATFTLPGLAGLVLTIGMAVDANVLIFERIREEQRRGGAVRLAVQNGFGRAFTTIVDANVTTLLVAVVLYMIGTDQVRGFAVTLFIGIVMSMFTALYVGRLLFDIWERAKRRELLKMNSLPGLAGREFNFIGHRRKAAVVSLLVIVGGMVALVSRGLSNFDIDFRGGQAVSFELQQIPSGATAGDVKALIEAKKPEQFEDAITLEELTGLEDAAGAAATAEAASTARRFRLRTTTTESSSSGSKDSVNAAIQAWIADAFDGQAEYALTRMVVKSGGVTAINDPAAPEFHQGRQVTVSFSEDSTVQLENARAYVSEALAGADGDAAAAEQQFEISAKGNATGTVSRDWTVRFKTVLEPDQVSAVLATLKTNLDGKPRFDEVTAFDSAVAEEMQNSAILAMLFSLVAIVGYIWFRFQRIDFGLAAVVALVHDVLVVLGGVALAGLGAGQFGLDGGVLQLQDFKINLPMIAAFLTIVGYSLNDTIVVFDRIREVRGKNPSLTHDMVNLSLNQTLARTLLTSITTLIVVVILYVGGGDGIHGFAYCLVLGVVVGTYSSIFVASPALLWMMDPDSLFNRAAAKLSGTAQSPSRQRAASTS